LPNEISAFSDDGSGGLIKNVAVTSSWQFAEANA
jgi:hypothetical protein